MFRNFRIKKPYNKYGNKPAVINGLRFGSKLELYCYNTLKNLKIDFEFQKTFELQPHIKKENGRILRDIRVIVDFVLFVGGKTIFIDTKGHFPKDSKLKYKMLEYKYITNRIEYELYFPKDKKAVESLVLRINEKRKNGL